ncbi:MAG: prepilin-type N-terminal cleavage/methylation domain-containing protein [Thermosynechococcaceae cyanobacterium MS004]|nr:prepilin-type N-terminal cleavage/methylation domain-containing protein [Thermosynechococcaceae cyanobacterium MS004]
MNSSFKQSLSILNRLPHIKRDQGFTLVEVLVAALLTVILTGVAMQTLVAAAAVRVKAQEASEATTWIESDFTELKSEANGEDMGYCPNGSAASDCAGISDNYKTEPAKCNASTQDSGYAKDLQTLLGQQTDTAKLSVIGQRPYVLRRTTSIKNQAPYNTLQIAYAVYRGTSATGTPMNTYYTEVIPGASFSCR